MFLRLYTQSQNVHTFLFKLHLTLRNLLHGSMWLIVLKCASFILGNKGKDKYLVLTLIVSTLENLGDRFFLLSGRV